jgi:hypothetical protein
LSSENDDKNYNDDARTHHLLQRSSSSILFTNSRFLGSFATAREYYMSMAPLVLEESRCIIAESLTTLSSSRQRNNHQQQQQQFSLELVSMNEKYPKYTKQHRLTAPLILNFQIVATNNSDGRGGGMKYRQDRCSSSNYDSSNNISSSSMKWTRPGNVLLLRRQQQKQRQQQLDNNSSRNNLQNSVLACIVPNGGNRQSESSSSSSATLSLMIVRRGELNLDEELDHSSSSSCSSTQSCFFVATAITTVISQVRQMEACLRMVKVSFIRKVLGQKDAIHTRFDATSDDDDDQEDDEEVLVEYDDDRDNFLPLDDEDCTTTTTSIDGVTANNDWNEDMSHLLTKIPTLNETQERAATMFLNSPKESIILIQGRE